MPQNHSTHRLLSNTVFGLSTLIVLAFPWILGGQLLLAQMAAMALATLMLLFSLASGGRSIKIPLFLLLCLTGYISIQYANPAYAQEWQTGLRVWNLIPLDHISWLPSSINSDFTEASPLRFLIISLPAWLFALALYKRRRRFLREYLLPLVALNASLIALVGLIQLNLESRSILGIFNAVDEDLRLFFATFLYKNHAAAFFNLGLGASLGSFFAFNRSSEKRRSNPSWLFFLCAIVLLSAVIFSRSRFGFLCSLGILAVFAPLVFKQLRQSGISRKWTTFLGSTLVILSGFGGIYLLNSQGAKHLQTLNAQITEDFSFKQRQLAYRGELLMFANKPVYGWGAGNFRHGFREFQNLDAEREKMRNPYMQRHELNFFWQHAHNDYLEWLIELGVVGTLILVSIPGYFFWIIFKSRRWKEPVALMLLAGLGSTMVHALVDFPFQNPAVLMSWVALLVITARHCKAGEERYRKNENIPGKV